jgi:hypothetical protein
MITVKDLPAVGAAGEGEVIKGDESTFQLASSMAEVQGPIAFRTWLQVATATAAICASKSRNRRVLEYYGVLWDLRYVYALTNGPNPTSAADIIAMMHTAFPRWRLDKGYRSTVESIFCLFHYDCERLGREDGGVNVD